MHRSSFKCCLSIFLFSCFSISVYSSPDLKFLYYDPLHATRRNVISQEIRLFSEEPLPTHPQGLTYITQNPAEDPQPHEFYSYDPTPSDHKKAYYYTITPQAESNSLMNQDVTSILEGPVIKSWIPSFKTFILVTPPPGISCSSSTSNNEQPSSRRSLSQKRGIIKRRIEEELLKGTTPPSLEELIQIIKNDKDCKRDTPSKNRYIRQNVKRDVKAIATKEKQNLLLADKAKQCLGMEPHSHTASQSAPLTSVPSALPIAPPPQPPQPFPINDTPTTVLTFSFSQLPSVSFSTPVEQVDPSEVEKFLNDLDILLSNHSTH